MYLFGYNLLVMQILFCNTMSNEYENHSFVKKCKVCGDKALGYNFNGLSCEPCKAFFRRNAFEFENLTCRNNHECKISISTRRYCRKCRMEKCFAIGMKKDIILQPQKEESTDSSSKIIENRISQSIVPDLPSHQIDLLDEVHQAITLSYCDESSLEVVEHLQTIVQILNVPGVYVRSVIKSCKGISAFKCLKPSDQLILLKSIYPENTFLRIAYKYQTESGGWTGLKSEFEAKAVFVTFETFAKFIHQDIVNVFSAFINTLHREMENDFRIRDLVFAILLFKPRENITCFEFVRYNHTVYCYLLRQYFQHKYQDTYQASRKYISLMNLLNKMDYISELIRQIYAEMSSRKDEMLEALVEIYNLH